MSVSDAVRSLNLLIALVGIHGAGLMNVRAYSYGLYCHGLYSHGLCSYGLYGYGICGHGLYSFGLYNHGFYRYGLYSYGLYSYDLYSHRNGCVLADAVRSLNLPCLGRNPRRWPHACPSI